MSMVCPHLDSQACTHPYCFFISIRADRWSCELSESEMSDLNLPYILNRVTTESTMISCIETQSRNC